MGPEKAALREIQKAKALRVAKLVGVAVDPSLDSREY